jgi:hypothetical protein
MCSTAAQHPCCCECCCCVVWPGVPEAVLLLLCASMERCILSPGHNLAAAGTPADSTWLLRHGSVLAAHPDMLVGVQWHCSWPGSEASAASSVHC